VGYDPSASVVTASARANSIGLKNISVTGDVDIVANTSYDLIIFSHVAEHLVDFGIFSRFSEMLESGGKLYVEVPDMLRYGEFRRRSFLYYFDRLHINHFSPQALASG